MFGFARFDQHDANRTTGHGVDLGDPQGSVSGQRQDCELEAVPLDGDEPVHDDPPRIEAYFRWASDKAENRAVVAYVSMHGSTAMMADHLVGALADREIMVWKFDLTVTDMGKVAISLVDAATLVIGTPTVNGGPDLDREQSLQPVMAGAAPALLPSSATSPSCNTNATLRAGFRNVPG